MIDYSLLADASLLYEKAGFSKIEAPWLVPDDVMAITASPGATMFPLLDEGLLVASGEQSLLSLWSRGKLPTGRWQCTTPCFRDDDLDDLHRRYFMKLELIDTEPSDQKLNDTICYCLEFFRRHVECTVVPTDPTHPSDLEGTTFDIVTVESDIELGSYGIRRSDIGAWIYATGCAEPRLSYSIARELDEIQ